MYHTHTRAYNRLKIYLNHQSGVSKSKHTQLIRVVCPPYLLPSSLLLYEKKVFKYLLVWDYKIYHFNCLKVLLTKLRSYKDLPLNALNILTIYHKWWHITTSPVSLSLLLSFYYLYMIYCLNSSQIIKVIRLTKFVYVVHTTTKVH